MQKEFQGIFRVNLGKDNFRWKWRNFCRIKYVSF